MREFEFAAKAYAHGYEVANVGRALPSNGGGFPRYFKTGILTASGGLIYGVKPYWDRGQSR